MTEVSAVQLHCLLTGGFLTINILGLLIVDVSGVFHTDYLEDSANSKS